MEERSSVHVCMEAVGVTARQTQLPTGKSCKEPALKKPFRNMAEVRGGTFRDQKFVQMMVLSSATPGWLGL